MTDERISAMKAFLAAFNRHDVDAIMSYFVDDCEFDTPRGPTPFGRRLRGKKEVRERIAARLEDRRMSAGYRGPRRKGRTSSSHSAGCSWAG